MTESGSLPPSSEGAEGANVFAGSFLASLVREAVAEGRLKGSLERAEYAGKPWFFSPSVFLLRKRQLPRQREPEE